MTGKEALTKVDCLLTEYVCRLKPENSLCCEDDDGSEYIEIIEKELDEFLEYKKLEEKVGLSLFIINKALTEGIWFKYDSSKPIIFVEPCDVNPTKGSYLRIFNSTILEFKDYGKTWALTREELEND